VCPDDTLCRCCGTRAPLDANMYCRPCNDTLEGEPWRDDPDEVGMEPTGSCENCGTNLYPDDGPLCDYCSRLSGGIG
jgi:methionyl-tRNA synthetase